MAKPDSEYNRQPFVGFRAPESTVVSMTTTAARQGLSKSELIRRALGAYFDEHPLPNGGEAA